MKRNDDATCDTCPYWERLETDQGYCRRRAPVSVPQIAIVNAILEIAVSIDKRADIDDINMAFDEQWPSCPRTFDEEFCGEHPDFFLTPVLTLLKPGIDVPVQII